jgi:hypothetical protein
MLVYYSYCVRCALRIEVNQLQSRSPVKFCVFLNGGTVKRTMDVKQKQRAVIEFLLLEGCEGDDIVLRFQNASGQDAYCRESAFR